MIKRVPRKRVLVPPGMKIAYPPKHKRMTSKEYLSFILNDPNVDPHTRMRAAIALLPYEHEPASRSGKKEERQEAAQGAGGGTGWGDDLVPAVTN